MMSKAADTDRLSKRQAMIAGLVNKIEAIVRKKPPIEDPDLDDDDTPVDVETLVLVIDDDSTDDEAEARAKAEVKPDATAMERPPPLMTPMTPATPGAPSEQSYQCDKCEFHTRSRGSLFRHAQVMHDAAGPGGARHVQCDYCGKKFSEERKMLYHVDAVHLGVKPYQCELCDFKATRPEQVKNHKK